MNGEKCFCFYRKFAAYGYMFCWRTHEVINDVEKCKNCNMRLSEERRKERRYQFG